MRIVSHSFGAGLRARGPKRGRNVIRWLVLAGGAAFLAGCVSPPPYPAYPPLGYLPPPYVAQPPVVAPQPGPVPLYPAPRREAAPAPEISVDPLPEPDPVPEPEAPSAAIPETPAAPVPDAAPPPPTQAGPGADVLQGFRPMRGQTRPGL